MLNGANIVDSVHDVGNCGCEVAIRFALEFGHLGDQSRAQILEELFVGIYLCLQDR